MPLYRFEEVPEEHHSLFEGCGCEMLMAVGALLGLLYVFAQFWWVLLIIAAIILLIRIVGSH